MANQNNNDPGYKMHIYKQCIATLASSLLSISGGLTFGITTVMLPQLREDKTFPYDQYYESWIASVATLSMIFSCPLTGTVLDRLGRRLSHIIFSIPFIIGWLCIINANDNTLILIGRFITGISNGATRPTTLVYIGEIADPKYRSTLMFVSGLSIHIGVFFSHVIGQYFYWKTSCALCLIPAVLSLIAFIFLKESPLWLISKGRIDEGLESYKWFRGEGNHAKMELNSIMEGQKEVSEKITLKEFKNFVLSRNFIKVTIVVIFLSLALPASGINVIAFYAVDVYSKTFLGKIDAYVLVLAVDCVRTFESIVLCIFAKFLPKKKITFMVCCFGVIISLFLLCILLYADSVKLFWILVTLMILYSGFGSAIITIGWTFIPEILPNNFRGFGSALATLTSYGFMFVLVKMLPHVLDVYGVITVYAIFASATLICTIALYSLLPETGGKTLQDIENIFLKSNESNITKL